MKIDIGHGKGQGDRTYLDAPDEVDVGNETIDILLHEGVVVDTIRGPVDEVVRDEEGQNMDQNTQSQSKISCEQRLLRWMSVRYLVFLRLSKRVERAKRNVMRAEA